MGTKSLVWTRDPAIIDLFLLPLRRVRFLQPMTASILSNGRNSGAFGMAGGEPGAPGINRVERADGRVELLGHIGQVDMGAGDVFVIETPGGGGYGPPANAS